MGYTCKNYMTEGGDKTVIGGMLEILEGATVTGLPATPAATTEAEGLVKQAANVEAIVAPETGSVGETVNGILTALKAAGIMVDDV